MARIGILSTAIASVAIGASFSMAQEAPSSTNLDDIAYEGIIARNSPIEVEKMLQIWARRLGTLIVADPSIASVRIQFLQTDVTLTWGLFKKLLEFHDVVLEEREVRGRWITYATRRGTLLPKTSVATPIVGPGEELPRREEIVTAILQVTHGSGADIFGNLRQVQAMRDQNRIGSMLYVRGPEVIVIVDVASSVDYYARLVRAMDVRAPGQVTRVFHITFAPVEEVVKIVSGLVKSPANSPGIPGTTGPTSPNVIPDPRTNKLFVQCYPEQLQEIEWMLGELDVKAQTKPSTRHFYACRFADAFYLAEKVSEIFGVAGPSAPASDRKRSTPRTAPNAAPSPTAEKKDVSSIETRIVADERSNALIITAEEGVFREILAVLQGTDGHPGLDRTARRILIEAQIWEVSTPNDNIAIGFELEGLTNPKRGEVRPAAGTSFGLTSLGIDSTTGLPTRTPNAAAGFTALLMKDRFDRVPIVLQAIASLEKTRLVTTPFAVTNDNDEVKFSSGTSVAYVKNSYGVVGGGVPATAVDYADATTDLVVKPQVHSDESLTLEVSIHLKSIAGTGGPGLPPTLDTRSYDGVVTVPNMKYVVFGGLESETSTQAENKVPFLGDIPILGHLFKHKQWTKSQARIYIFIRPTILGDDVRPWTRVSQDLRERAHIESEREEWLPPIVAEWVVRKPEATLQDRVFDVFGTGSGCPFSLQPKDE